MTAASTTGGLSISVPGDWIEVVPEDLSDHDSADALVGQHLEEFKQLAPYRESLVDAVAQTMDRARREGVLFCAVYGDVSDEKEPVIANFSLATAPAPPINADRPDMPRVAEVEELLAEKEPNVSQRVVNSILLPGGPAVRIARIQELPLEGTGRSLVTLTVQYFFSVPEEDQFVVATFATPSIGAHLRLQAIFHEIAGTLRFGPPPEASNNGA